MVDNLIRQNDSQNVGTDITPVEESYMFASRRPVARFYFNSYGLSIFKGYKVTRTGVRKGTENFVPFEHEIRRHAQFADRSHHGAWQT